MKAICIQEPGKVEIQDIEKPVRKPGEALLKMLYGGICGSDLGSYRGANAYVSYPRIPGHELAAEIVEIDDNDRGLKPGMIVTCNPYFNCGTCYSCRRGLVNACTDNQTMGVQREGGFAGNISPCPLSGSMTARACLPRLWLSSSLSASATTACPGPMCKRASGCW